jgi:tetratricopeptide (TPR) repeat protein
LENAISSDRDLLDVVSLIQHPNADPAKILDARPDGYRDRQRKLFLFAACQRSRFDAENAIRFFRTAYEIDSTTPAGQCAVHVMALDTNALSIYGKNAVDKEFESFERLADKHADDIFIRWMLAVECRTWHRNEEGVKHYRKILEKWRTGPALVHQTFANLLDETKQYEEALAERKLTVKMEPSGWSFNGLASTLHYLGRLEEAEKAHARATQLDPLNAKYWSNWAYTLRDEGKYDEAIRKCEYSAKLAPDFMLTWYNWALCLEANGLKADALEKFEKALTLYPQDKNIPPKIEALKKELGK